MLEEKIKKELLQIVGDENYLDAPEDMINYSYDAFVPETRPDVALLP